MSKKIKWPKKLDSGFLHERTVVCSLLFLLVIFTFDWFFQRLPLSGYGLILITLVLITLATSITCHGIKWLITSSKPLFLSLPKEEAQQEKWMTLAHQFENQLFKKLLRKCMAGLTSFQYPTHLYEQVRLLLKDIEKDFIKTWYSEVSHNPSFLFESHTILQELSHKIIKRLRKCNYRNLISQILILYLNSLQEYKKSLKKITRLHADPNSGSNLNLSEASRYFHPASQSEQLLNYYLKKITRVIFKEFTSQEFSHSLECKILTGIIARKVIKKLLITLEDPTWINLKLIYLLNAQTHQQLMQGKAYTVKENLLVPDKGDSAIKKSTPLAKRYMATNLCAPDQFNGDVFRPGGTVDKNSLTLPLHGLNMDETQPNISTVLTGFISSTAGPLLPDNISVHYKPLNKMWQSPVTEIKEIRESKTLAEIFPNGINEKTPFGRSKSTDTLPIPIEPEMDPVDDSSCIQSSKLADCPSPYEAQGMKIRDVSVAEDLWKFTESSLSPVEAQAKTRPISMGEEPSEGGDVASSVDSAKSVLLPRKPVKKLTKTHSFDKESFSLEESDDTNNDRKEREPVPGEANQPSSPSYQRDVSPVYEEPEDFATTIAKLRSLLQQRESSSTYSDKSNSSIDSQSADKSHCSNKSLSLEDPFESNPQPGDLPSDGRLFMNVCIPKGELTTESGSTHVAYTIQYDGIYVIKGEQNAEPKLVRRTTVVKRRFQDFLQLEMKLEESEEFRAAMKGLKGPSKWLNLPSNAKAEESLSRKDLLEGFLCQICSKVEFSSSSDLHRFLAYGQSSALAKKDSEPSSLRIDKLLANKVTGVFNSIKTVLPSFDFDSPAFITTNDGVKGVQEQKLLQGFLNFGNKPDPFEIKLNFIAKDQTGESLVNDIRHYLSQKSDCIEDAVDVLNSSDWLTEQKECRFISAEDTCVWENYKDVLDDDLEPLDASMPIYALLIDILSELLQDSDSWLVKEPVIRLVKVTSGHWEARLQEEMSKWDWDRIVGNLIRLLRAVVFHSGAEEGAQVTAEGTKAALKDVIFELIPDWVTEFVTADGLSSAISLFVDSLQHLRPNRDVLLRLFDIVLVHVLSCPHLASTATATAATHNCTETEEVTSTTKSD